MIELDSIQLEAVEALCTQGLVVVTGGPGTGKTTTLKAALVELADRAKAQLRCAPFVALTAPTGKAARRMSEATGQAAGTLHRLLGWGGGDGWEHNASDPLPYDLVVVDEASMLDTGLACALFSACDPRRTRVVLVGDVNQLPSVGPGRVLGDVIDSSRVPVVRLETVHRQAQKSWVYRNAPKILHGEPIDLAKTDDFEWIEIDDPESLATSLVQVYEDELNIWAKAHDAGAEDAFDAVQILGPQRKGPIGVETLNIAIQKAVQGDTQGGWEVNDDLRLCDGDKVIQTKNNYDLGVMNGETGIVQGVTKGKLVVRIEADEKVYDKGSAQNLLLGYAITIHKSQGSEFSTCIVVCHSSHARMLSRQLLYTAITRAKGRLILIGDRGGLDRALNNARVAERQTGLVGRIERAVKGGAT